MNNVSLVGNLTRDPSYFGEKVEDGKKTFVAKFDIATEVGYDSEKKEPRVEFVPITAFGISEAFRPHLLKGRRVAITGRVSNESYEKDGQKVYTCCVKTSNGAVRLIDSPKKAE